jgi:hypothetical protein
MMLISPGSHPWHWQVLRIDKCGKRALCRCCCGTTREVSVADLQSGVSQSCSCKPLTSRQIQSLKRERQQWLLREQLRG